MSIQDKIDLTELDMTEHQVKAFFLGVLSAETPLFFSKALDEVLSSTPEARKTLEHSFLELWDEVQKNPKNGLKTMIPQEADTLKFLEVTKDQLDYFLTGMSLSGTHFENCKDQDLRNFINDLEDAVEDMEDLLSDENSSEDEAHQLKEFLIEIWSEFTDSKQ
jgi:hypothetical protein